MTTDRKLRPTGKRNMNRIKRAAVGSVVSFGLAAGAATMLAAPAQARPIHPDYYLSNSSKSSTGAIYHGVTDGRLVSPSLTLEPGQGTRGKGKYFTYATDTRDKPYGVKVWQPARTRLKVYIWFGVWVRSHNYHCQSRGRDVWVTKGLDNQNGSNRVKIRPC